MGVRASVRVAGTILLGLGISLLPAASAALTNPQGQSSESLGKLRGIAETQHEIAVILIRKKEFTKAQEEAQKIFNLNWPPDQEPILLKELLFFSDQFLHQGQTEIGVQLLEANLKVFKSPANQVRILKEMGYFRKKMNQDDKALECFREAGRIEKTIPK
jgi:tetratricopeptide (TPR) repeat protein